MLLSLLIPILGLSQCQVYKAVEGKRARNIQFGPFTVGSKAECELACNCARGDASEEECSHFSGVVQPDDCRIYYYTPSWCSFLGDFRANACMMPIEEHHLEETTATSKAVASDKKCSLEKSDNWPNTGIWSEWTITGHCPTTCGSCSNSTRKRTCLNTCGDCPCIGPSEDVGPCGIALCPFKGEHSFTCCSTYKKCLNSNTNTFFCGLANTPEIPKCDTKN